MFPQSFSQRGLCFPGLSDIRLSHRFCTRGGFFSLFLLFVTSSDHFFSVCVPPEAPVNGPLMSPLCFQGSSEVGRLLHAGCWTHPAGLLLLHRVSPAGGADDPESEPAAGEPEQAAAEPALPRRHAPGKSLPGVMG